MMESSLDDLDFYNMCYACMTLGLYCDSGCQAHNLSDDMKYEIIASYFYF